MSKTEKLNLAIVGCGTVADYGHLPAICEIPDFKIAAYVDTNRANAEKFAEKFGQAEIYDDYRKVIDRKDIDVVAVFTPPTSHFEIIRDALQAGKDVFTEKPMVDSVAKGEELVELCRRTGRKLFVGFLLRYTGVFQQMAEAIRSGMIGRPMVFRMICMEHYGSKEPWDRAMNSFILDTSPGFDCGSHYVDLMRWYCGGEATRIQGIGGRVNPDVPEGHFDWESFQIEFSDGSRGLYEAGWGYSFPYGRYTKEAIGPNGVLGVRMAEIEEGQEAGAELVYLDNDNQEKVLARSPWKGFEGEWEQFAKMLRENLDPMDALEDALASLRIVEAGHLSALESVKRIKYF